MSDHAERKAFDDRDHCGAAAEAGMANEADDTVVAKQSAGITSQTRGRTCCAPAESAAPRGSATAGQQPRDLGDPFVQLDDGRAA